MSRKQTTFRFDRELYQEIKQAADTEGRSATNLIEFVMRKWLDHTKRKKREARS